MLQHASTVGYALKKRFVEEPVNLRFPAWAGLIVLGDVAIFVPIFFFVFYTLGAIFPTLAIVEDPNPPAYEPVALDETADQGPEASRPGKPITSSFRATRRLVGSIAGWKSYFRGIIPFTMYAISSGILENIFKGFLPYLPIGALIAPLALTQLLAAWTHIVITAPSDRKFYQRFPPFRKTFEATCFPILAVWLANSINVAVPAAVGQLLGLDWPSKIIQDPQGPDPNPNPNPLDPHLIWKSLVVVLLAFFFRLTISLPAEVLLVRVQASLLPPDEETVIPFDRSFGGRVDPVVVTGKGFVTMRDALQTFPRESWIRLYKLYAKVVGITFGAYSLLIAVIIPETILIVAGSTKLPPVEVSF